MLIYAFPEFLWNARSIILLSNGKRRKLYPATAGWLEPCRKNIAKRQIFPVEMGTEIPPPIAILMKLYFDGTITDGDLLRAKRKPDRAYAVREEMRAASVQMQG